MKRFFLSLAVTGLFLLSGCSKSGEEEAETCEDLNTTKVVFTNSTSASLRLVLSRTLTPQMVPVDPEFTIDIAAGQSVTREFNAGRWVTSWYNGCPSTCNTRAQLFKDFAQCMEYQEGM